MNKPRRTGRQVANETLFHLKNIRFKNILTIDELRIPTGKTAITGESGGGKTTLLLLLNRFISPDEGTITYCGSNITDCDPIDHRRNVVMLAQNPVIFPGSIRANLLAGITFVNDRIPDDDKLKTVLEQMRLRKELDETPDKLSGGEKQRLAIARVMLMNPEVLLLDEPSSALDDEMEENIIRTLMNHCTNNGLSVVVVTHSKALAQQFCERTITVENTRAYYESGERLD